MKLLRSMTGFAEASAEEQGRVVRAGVRSVNHRYLDLQAHLPEGLEALETIAQRLVRERVRRGHVDVFVRVESTAADGVRVNRPAAELYLRTARDLARDFGLVAEPDLGAILRLPGVVDAAGAVAAGGSEQIARVFERTLAEALDRLDRMRAEEGARLGRELVSMTAGLLDKVGKIQGLGEKARASYLERLRERIRELAGDTAVEPGRLAQEAALLATRSDTTEESTRLLSHLEQFARVLDAGAEAGKKLDFLCQEMQREVNTTLAKTPALGPDGLEITRFALAVKAEIEKLKEQVQNLE